MTSIKPLSIRASPEVRPCTELSRRIGQHHSDSRVPYIDAFLRTLPKCENCAFFIYLELFPSEPRVRLMKRTAIT